MIRVILLGVWALLAAACGGGGHNPVVSGSPEAPVEFRGASVTGSHPHSALPAIEAGWAQATQLTGLAGPDPRGWRIELSDPPIPLCGDQVGPWGGCYDPRLHVILASWVGGLAGLEEIMTHEFCHYLRGVRGSGVGPGCLTERRVRP